MTDDHKAAALEGFLSNPVAVAYAWQAAGPGGRTLAGYSGDEQTRIWVGSAHGCTVQYAAKAPGQGGLAEVFVRGILTAEVAGVELVDADGVQLAFSANYQGTAPVPATEVPDLAVWLREQIAEIRRLAELGPEQPWPTDLDPFLHWVLQASVTALAQCEAHEKLLDLHPQSSELGWLCALCGGEGQNIDCTYPCDTIRVTALADQHCPGFREEWRRG